MDDARTIGVTMKSNREVGHSLAVATCGGFVLRSEGIQMFPDSPREIYANNTLDLVICQLRFPTILRIDSEVPADFQERIRADFPAYSNATTLELPPGIPFEVAALLKSQIRSHTFASADGLHSLTLTNEFLAIASKAYQDNKTFLARFGNAKLALLDIYKPAYFSRVGLRYQNVIDRRALGIDGEPWKHLISEWAAGELAEHLADKVVSSTKETEFALDDTDGVRLRHGLSGSEEDQTYFIDADFFTTTRTEVDDVDEVLSRFASQSGRLFRYVTTTTLRNAMRKAPPNN